MAVLGSNQDAQLVERRAGFVSRCVRLTVFLCSAAKSALARPNDALTLKQPKDGLRPLPALHRHCADGDQARELAQSSLLAWTKPGTGTLCTNVHSTAVTALPLAVCRIRVEVEPPCGEGRRKERRI